jgi:hypothetical protein
MAHLFRYCGLLFVAALLFISTSVSSAEPPAGIDPPLAKRALDELRRALAKEQGFIKVHAADSLISLGFGAEILPVFIQEKQLHGNEKLVRVGIWRVLAQVCPTLGERERYLDALVVAAFDQQGTDRTQAIESLAKLRYAIPTGELIEYRQLADELTASAEICARWLLAVNGANGAINSLSQLLASDAIETRAITAYALRHVAMQQKLPPNLLAQLQEAARQPSDSWMQVYLESAAYVTADDAKIRKEFVQRLIQRVTAKSATKDEKYEFANGLAVKATTAELPLLTKLLADRDPDVRIAAANAILQIDKRGR